MAILIYFPTSNTQEFPFLSTLVFLIFCFLGNSHSDWGEMVSHCDFDLSSLMII
jgi:hypothetical protein